LLGWLQDTFSQIDPVFSGFRATCLAEVLVVHVVRDLDEVHRVRAHEQIAQVRELAMVSGGGSTIRGTMAKISFT
jgi:hypothetical protein